MTAAISVKSALSFKKIIKTGEFLCSYFNIEDRRKKQYFFGILCFVISRKVKMQLKPKKSCAVYREGAGTD